MRKGNIISNSRNTVFNIETNFQKNIFDEDFLDEKDKALSPIVLSDEIPEETIKNPLKKTKKKETNLKINEVKDIKYNSNVEYIGSKVDDNNEELLEILDEEVYKIIDEQKFRNYVRNLIMQK